MKLGLEECEICDGAIAPNAPRVPYGSLFAHPDCIGLFPAQARARRAATTDGASSNSTAAPATNVRTPDAGDLVAAAMAASDRAWSTDAPFRDLVSEELFKSTGHRLPEPGQQAAPVSGDNGDKVCAAMGLTGAPHPSTQPSGAATNKSAQELVSEAMGLR